MPNLNLNVQEDASGTEWEFVGLNKIDFSNVTSVVLDITGDFEGDITGNITGDITGSISGDVSGDITGDITGSISGDVSGNVTGDVTGSLTGAVYTVVEDHAADGALTVTSKYHTLSKDSAGGYTLVAASAANNGLELFITATTAQAHVLTAAGAFSGVGVTEGNTVATFGGAKGDTFRCVSDGTTWFVPIAGTNVTFSTPG